MGCRMKKPIGWDSLKSLKTKNICFNSRPFSNPQLSSEKFEVVEEPSFVDLHLEVSQKVDALIAESEQEISPEKSECESKEKIISASNKNLFSFGD